MKALTRAQYDAFWRGGYLMVEDAVDAGLLDALCQDVDNWVEESRRHTEPFGDTLDGRPRFDLETGHNPERPALRRVSAPIEVSEAYFQSDHRQPHDRLYRRLIGPNSSFTTPRSTPSCRGQVPTSNGIRILCLPRIATTTSLPPC